MRAALLLVPGLLGAAAPPASSQQQRTLRAWSVRDGLAHDRINAFHVDRAGFLWIATWEGLTRFDGRSCTSLGSSDGLPNPLVWVVGEDDAGRLWVGTHTGLARLVDDAGERRRRGGLAFASYAIDLPEAGGSDANLANSIQEIVCDPRGILWIATPLGLIRAEPAGDTLRCTLAWSASGANPASRPPDWRVQACFRQGDRIWFLTDGALLEVRADVVREHPGPGGALLVDHVHSQPRADGRALVATTEGIFGFDPAAAASGAGAFVRVGPLPPPDETIHALAWASDGTIWIATVHGLIERPPAESAEARHWTKQDGLPDDELRALLLDAEGTLWIGTQIGGVARLAPSAIRSFATADDRRPINVNRLVAGVDATIYASCEYRGIFRVDPHGLAYVPGGDRPAFSNVHMRFACDRRGDFWLGTDDALWHAPGPALDLTQSRRVPLSGAPAGTGVGAEIHETPEGRIRCGGRDGHLWEVDPAEGADAPARALPAALTPPLTARSFLDDAEGRHWIATPDDLWRIEGDRLVAVPLLLETPGPPPRPGHPLRPRALFCDRAGALWVGTRFDGLLVARTPAADAARFVQITRRDGLASNAVFAILDDTAGDLWLGTSRGLDRLAPESGDVRHYASQEGLAGDLVNDLLRDDAGRIWVACSGGVSCIDPAAEPAAGSAPPVLFTRCAIAGEEQPLPLHGTTHLALPPLAATTRSLLVAFTAVDLVRGGSLRFEHRLEGIDDGWSGASSDDSVQYAGLAAGRYRLLVRAVTPDGMPGDPPSVAEFELLAPWWRRAWFVAAAAAALLLAAVAIHRARLQRVLELDRIRAQIATDLHDEMGANLSQIAILAEVVRRDAAPEPAATLREVAELARATRAAMSDLVWAIDPRHDRVADLVQRVRQAAVNLVEAAGGELLFTAPPQETLASVALGPSARRHLLCFAKEALHNAARHAGARQVAVTVGLDGTALDLVVADTGRGFDPAVVHRGQGLTGMERRARELGAEFKIDSSAGLGTRIELVVPRHVLQ